MMVHVDDFLCTFHEDFSREILENLFVWGSVVIVDKLTPAWLLPRQRDHIGRERRQDHVQGDSEVLHRRHDLRKHRAWALQGGREADRGRVEGIPISFGIPTVARLADTA